MLGVFSSVRVFTCVGLRGGFGGGGGGVRYKTSDLPPLFNLLSFLLSE